MLYLAHYFGDTCPQIQRFAPVEHVSHNTCVVVKTCKHCGHSAHRYRCPHVEDGWRVCHCGARDTQQEIADAFERLRLALLTPERRAESRAFGERAQLACCGRVCKPTVC